MRKIVLVLAILVCASACFADISNWEKDEKYPLLRSEEISIKYADHLWNRAKCSIYIDENTVSFLMKKGGSWLFRVKTVDGVNHSYKGNHNKTGRIVINQNTAIYSFPDEMIRDFLVGCTVIAYPDSEPHSSYNFGLVKLPLEDLQKVRPDWK